VKRLLKDVTFHIDGGDMCALMVKIYFSRYCSYLFRDHLALVFLLFATFYAESDLGKSTLLDLMANRKDVGTWSGEIFVNKKPRSSLFNRDSAYVLQSDLHIGESIGVFFCLTCAKPP
jgi:hypothetical protein